MEKGEEYYIDLIKEIKKKRKEQESIKFFNEEIDIFHRIISNLF